MEPGAFDHFLDWPVQMTDPSDTLPCRRQPVLPPPYALFRSQPMLIGGRQDSPQISEPIRRTRSLANAVLLKLILLLSGALLRARRTRSRDRWRARTPRLASAKKYTAATRNSLAIGERKH